MSNKTKIKCQFADGEIVFLYLYENGVMPCPICGFLENPEEHTYPYPFGPDTIDEILRLRWLDLIVSGNWGNIYLAQGYSFINNLNHAIKQLENIDIFLSEEKIQELKKKEKNNS